MSLFSQWTTKCPGPSRNSSILHEDEGGRETIWDELIDTVESHFLDPEPYRRLGLPQLAKLLETKLPTSRTARSGDLGEILGSEYVEQETGYSLFIKRLRWKDGRNVSLRGDDLIGLATSDVRPIRVLKGEAKSRIGLSRSVVCEAITKLEENHGEPGPHTLTWLSDRLSGLGRTAEADAVLGVFFSDLDVGRLFHLIFTLSGNDPTAAFSNHAAGSVERELVGLVVQDHKGFVDQVFKDCGSGP